MRVTSKVGNFPSKFGHARPLRSGIIRHVRDGQTDRRTDKSNAYSPLPYGRGYNKPVCEQVLIYTAGHINYGGRVTDDWDRRCMMNVLGDYYNDTVLNVGHSYDASEVYKQLDPATELEVLVVRL